MVLLKVLDSMVMDTSLCNALSRTLCHIQLAWQVTRITPPSRVFLAMLTSSQLVKKFPALYGNQRFVTTFASAHHVSLSLATLIQFITKHPTLWRSNLLVSTHICMGFPSGFFRSGFHNNSLYVPPFFLIRATWTDHQILLELIIQTFLDEEYRSLSTSFCSFLSSPVSSSLLGPNILLSTACLKSVWMLFILSTSPNIYKFSTSLTKSFCNAQFTHQSISRQILKFPRQSTEGNVWY